MKIRVLLLSLILLVLHSACRQSGETVARGQAPAPEVASAGAAQGTGTKVGSMGRSVLPTPDLGYNAREGRAMYQYYCSTCHGEEGHGDGFNAYNLDPKPRDLADPSFQAKRSDDDLMAVIKSGGGAAGLSTGMPPWGRTLSERRIRNLIDYLRALARKPK